MASGRGSDGDVASTHVLEAVILALILLGAAYSVSTMQAAGDEQVRPRVSLQAIAEDTLVVLEGLADDRGSLLGLYVQDGFHCAYDVVPSALDCDGTRSANMSLKLQTYLPTGSGYAYGLSNGVTTRILYRSAVPEGETVSASRTFVPDWNMTFLQSELSCYDAAPDVNLTATPIWHGMVATPEHVNVTVGTLAGNGTRLEDGAWNVSLPAATRPASGTILANVTSDDGSFPGAASYGSCDLVGTSAVVAALRAASFSVPTSAPVGGTAVFTFDITSLASVAGLTVASVNATVYAPLAPRGVEPDTYVPVGVVAMDGTAGTATWSVPAENLYGAHPVKLTVRIQVGTVTLDAYRVAILQVALPTGEVPIDPPYRAVVQAWFPDWR